MSLAQPTLIETSIAAFLVTMIANAIMAYVNYRFNVKASILAEKRKALADEEARRLNADKSVLLIVAVRIYRRYPRRVGGSSARRIKSSLPRRTLRLARKRPQGAEDK